MQQGIDITMSFDGRQFKDNDIAGINRVADRIRDMITRVPWSDHYQHLPHDESDCQDELLYPGRITPNEWRNIIVFAFTDEAGMPINHLTIRCEFGTLLDGLKNTKFYSAFFELTGLLNHLYASKNDIIHYSTISLRSRYFWIVERLVYFAVTHKWCVPSWVRRSASDVHYWNTFFTTWDLCKHPLYVNEQSSVFSLSDIKKTMNYVVQSDTFKVTTVMVGIPAVAILLLVGAFKVADYLYDLPN